MNESRIYVDFNEMPSEHEVVLSKGDSKPDSTGRFVHFVEGMHIAVYMDDEDKNGKPDNLVAEGVACLNHYKDWAAGPRWLLKISKRGIRHESDDQRSE